MEDAHRLMVQILLSRGVVGEREMNDIYKEIRRRCQQDDNQGRANVPLSQFKNTINTQLNKVSMEIRQKPDEDTGEQMYALVQTMESDLGKLTTDYSPNQLELFKQTVALIVSSSKGVASSIDILNLADHLDKKMSKEDAESAINEFIDENWLKEEEGDVWLSSRCIMELEMYLRQTYEAIDHCHNCKEIAIKGHCCSQCEIKLHGYCAERLFRNCDRACPNCDQPWQ